MFHTGAQIPGKHPLLTGGGDTSRVMKLGTVAEANAAKRDIERIVKAWCDFRDAAGQSASVPKPRGKKAAKAKPSPKTPKPAARRKVRSKARAALR